MKHQGPRARSTARLGRGAYPPRTRDLWPAIELATGQIRQTMVLKDLAAACNMTPQSLCQLFRCHYGMTPMRWINCLRAVLAAEVIATCPNWSLALVGDFCGFTSQASLKRHFFALFQEEIGTFRTNFLAPQCGDAALLKTSPDRALFAGPDDVPPAVATMLIGRAIAKLHAWTRVPRRLSSAG